MQDRTDECTEGVLVVEENCRQQKNSIGEGDPVFLHLRAGLDQFLTFLGPMKEETSDHLLITFSSRSVQSFLSYSLKRTENPILDQL